LNGAKPMHGVTLQLTRVPVFLVAPTTMPEVRLQTLLTRLGKKVSRRFSEPSLRLVNASPFAVNPLQQTRIRNHLHLYLLVAALAALFALINTWVVGGLVALRHRHNLATARILGMTHRRLLQDNIRKVLGGWLLATAGSVGVLAIILALSRGPLSAMGLGGFRLVWFAWSVLVGVSAIILIALLVQRIPEVLYGWNDPTSKLTAIASAGRRRVGVAVLLGEIFFVALLSMVAAWGLRLYVNMMHADLGFLRQPATLVPIGLRQGYGVLSAFSVSMTDNTMSPDQVDRRFSNRRVVAPLETAVRGFATGVKTGFGPIPMPQPTSDAAALAYRSKTLQGCEAYISHGWLGAVQARMLVGRGFRTGAAGKAEVVIDTDVARRLFGSLKAVVGHWIEVPGSSLARLKVVGVVQAIRQTGASRPHCPTIYLDTYSHDMGSVQSGGGYLIIYPAIGRSRWKALSATLGRVLHQLAPQLQIDQMTNSNAQIARLYASQRRLASIMLLVASVTWLIALFSLWVMLCLHLGMQKRLLSILSALGSSPRRLYVEVVGGTLILAMIGAGLALLLAPWLSTQFALLAGTQAHTYGAPTWIALGLLLLAVWGVVHFPAWRAAHAEPAESLHEL